MNFNFFAKKLVCSKECVITNYFATDIENLFISEHGRAWRERGTRCIRRSWWTITPFTGRSKYKATYRTRCEQSVGVTKWTTRRGGREPLPREARDSGDLGETRDPRGRAKYRMLAPRASHLYDNWHILRVGWFISWLSYSCVQVRYVRRDFRGAQA